MTVRMSILGVNCLQHFSLIVDNGPMIGNIIPFVLIVNELAGLSFTDKDRFCYLSQHYIITEHTSNVHCKIWYIISVFSTCILHMFTEAMKIALLFIMENHGYTFDNEMKLQSKGGPIGLKITFFQCGDKLKRSKDETCIL